MQKIILLSIMLSIIPLASATTIFDGWIYSGDFIEREGVAYTFQIDASETTLLISSEAEEVFVDFNESAYTDYYHYEFKEKKEGKRDIIKNLWIPELHVAIETREPKLKISLEPSITKPLLNDVVEFSGEILNEGNQDADHFFLEIFIPSHLEIVSVRDAEQFGNTIRVSHWVIQNGISTFKFSVRIKTQMDARINATITTDWLEKSKKEDVNLYNVKPEKIIVITPTLRPSKLGLGKTGTLTIDVENKDGHNTVDITNFIMDFPDEINIFSGPFITRKENIFFDELSLSPGEKKTYTYKISPKRIGNLPLEYIAFFTVQGLSTFENDTFNIASESKLIVSTVRFQLDEPEIEGGKESNIYIRVYNPDDSVDYFDFNYVITSNFLDRIENTLPFFVAKQEEDILLKDFTTPYVDEDYQYNITLYGWYRTEFFDRFNFTVEKKLLITPTPFTPDLMILRNIPKSINESESITVSIAVRNIGTTRLDDIFVEDQTDGLLETFGKHARRIPRLEPSESKELYIYKATPDNTTTALTFKTIAEYVRGHQEYRIQNTTTLHLVPPPPRNETINLSEDLPPEDIPPEDRPAQVDDPVVNPPKQPIIHEPQTRAEGFWGKFKAFMKKLFGKREQAA
ncbi:MAG: hypothetical protein ABIH34_05870 [Nanoarchaeota archaeon]